jgi:serine/threonine protein kinase/tetratricopeptide (TPR) repeat protein
MIGKTISHYRIVEELGRGGMGVVYKAEDTKLGRTVALKFLPPEFTQDAEAKERFKHEAQAAAVLNHNNICTVYEIDEHEGQSFISMEYIEGLSLKSMIASGPLELSATMDIAIQIAAGLSEAHEKDVVHRDIKPANIMITAKGQAKIMDFGLAKLRSRTVLTREGTTLGTIAYMSPEQAKGRAVDHRTDIWSFGVMLFEMISGRRPFKGDYDQAMIYSLLNDSPEPLTAIRTGVPPELERIAAKCMEKNPDERYQTVADLMADLRHLGRIMKEDVTEDRSRAEPLPSRTKAGKLGWFPWVIVIAVVAVLAVILVPRFFGTSDKAGDERASSGLTMLVVLPFENLGSPDDEYFADGITDAITARLGGLSGLGVISRQSAIQYKESGKSTRQISEELGVDYILEGTIQRERSSDPGSRVRIIPQLVRCSDDIHVWADTYDEDMTEVFKLQTEIAERVARELDVALLEPERRMLAAKPTENVEAYEYYLKGIDHRDRAVNEDESWAMVRMFEKAVELDPNFAVAWARLSMSYTWMYWRMLGKEYLAKAWEAAEEAMRIDPDCPDGHLAYGYYHYYGSRNYERALEHFYKVQKQMPANVNAIQSIGFIKRRQGKWEEALKIFRSIYKVNPRSFAANWDHFGNTLIMIRRYDEAEKYIDRALSLAPDMAAAYYCKAEIAILRDGDRELAKSYFQKGIDLEPAERRCLYLGYSEMMMIRITHETPCEVAENLKLAMCSPSSIIEDALVKVALAQCCIEKGNDKEAAALMDSALVILEKDLQGEGQLKVKRHDALGWVYAHLGRKEDAIRAGKRAVELLPISKDAYDAPLYMHDLAQIYTIVGEYDAAVDQLEILLSVPSYVSVHSLRLDPVWDPLRDHPRFQLLLEENKPE